MGAKPKPTAQKVVQGSFKKHPERRNNNEPVPAAEIGDPPAHLDDFAVTAWHEIVENCCPGVFGNSDRIAVERAATLLAISRQPEKFEFTAAQENALKGYLAAFGMTPADRTKISVPGGGNKNPFQGF